VAPLLSATPTTKEIAEDLGVSERTTKRMNVIDDKATEEVKEKLAEDKISVNAAYEETIKQTKKTDPKPKKPDWFEENIEDDNERFIMREIVKLTKKIENECGILYMLTLRELINKYDHLNYKTSWK
jgi:predicted transcriptional regulator